MVLLHNHAPFREPASTALRHRVPCATLMVMPLSAGTFVAGIVVAIAIGVAVTAAWFRGRAAAEAAREAADPTRPIADTLARIETHMRDIEAQRQHMLGGLEQQLGALSKETVALSQALRAPNARGRWGELTLRRVAELAGMVPYCDFYEQESGVAQRPDMLVRLPAAVCWQSTPKFHWRHIWMPKPPPKRPRATPHSRGTRNNSTATSRS